MGRVTRGAPRPCKNSPARETLHDPPFIRHPPFVEHGR